jgi:hypothetical protein
MKFNVLGVYFDIRCGVIVLALVLIIVIEVFFVPNKKIPYFLRGTW